MKVEGLVARRVSFSDQGAEIRTYQLRGLRKDEVLIKARCSLVSIGTETTLYLSRRWQSADTSPGGGEDVWDFDDYGGGDIWDMERNRRFPGYALAGDVHRDMIGVVFDWQE